MTTRTPSLRAEEQIQELLRELQTDPQKGLSDTVACARLRRHGPNLLLNPLEAKPLPVLWGQLRTATTLLLAGAAIVLTCLGQARAALLIVALLILSAVARCTTKYRVEKPLRRLGSLTSPLAQVIRSGRLVYVKSVYLVPGDVVRLRTGDLIPADGRLIEALDLSTREETLTGAAVPVEKKALHLDDPSLPVVDRPSAVFMGTSVAVGRGTMVVVRTGAHTELGAVAAILGGDQAAGALRSGSTQDRRQP
ncbi:MAG: cation-transporting P-type ATPase [Armatimonadota bacterium]